MPRRTREIPAGTLRRQHGQEEIRLVRPAGVTRDGAGEALVRAVDWDVVGEPGDAAQRAGGAGTLEILALDGEREARALGQPQPHWPDLEIDLVDLARRERLPLVVRIAGQVLGRALRVELALRHAQPALRH